MNTERSPLVEIRANWLYGPKYDPSRFEIILQPALCLKAAMNKFVEPTMMENLVEEKL